MPPPTADVSVPAALMTEELILPPQQQNRMELEREQRSREEWAREVATFHHTGLRNRRYRDLTTEKYMLHIDGEGDAQWASIFRGERIIIPLRHSSGPRVQENLLRPIVDNAVAYHTTQPFEFMVEAKMERSARERAQVEQAWINHLVEEARWNAVFAEAMYLAMPSGMCPVHQFWRSDVSEDFYEATSPSIDMLGQGGRGFIDAFSGNPLDTVFSASARRSSYQRMTYGRILSADLVRHAFGHVPGAEGLEGSNKLPSAAVYQRIARRWAQAQLSMHGSGVIESGRDSEELIGLIYEEIGPGVLPDWPTGRLRIIALDGAASTDRDDVSGTGSFKNAFPLHEDALPGSDFSATNVYSHHRGDDILGGPWVRDLDDLNVQLNQLLSARRDYVRRSMRAPLLKAGVIHDDTSVYENDAEIEVDPMAPFEPKYLELPKGHVPVLDRDIQETREAMFRIGGWQAASRGEANAGDPAAKVVALAKYDDHVHGPPHLRFREAVESSAGFAWKLMRQYGDVPWLISAVGEELSHLADLWVDREKLGDTPPRFKLISGYGATPESRGQQLLNLFGLADREGRQVIDTPMLRKLWPDNSLFAEVDYSEQVRRRRPRVVNKAIEDACTTFREMNGFEEEGLANPAVQQMAQWVFLEIDQEFPLLMDDDVEQHLESLSLLTQDESIDSLVRHVARMRQNLYWNWLAQRQAAASMAAANPGGASAGAAQGRNVVQGAEPGGTTTSEDAARAAPGAVNNLTRQASQGG